METHIALIIISIQVVLCIYSFGKDVIKPLFPSTPMHRTQLNI